MTIPFHAEHISATPADLAGNNGLGRYIFLPGSDGRAKEIATHFQHLIVKPHARAHNLYLGTLYYHGQPIDVAAIASGMGCPSMEIIVHELFHLGARHFLRVGTAGSLQPYIKVGNLINVAAAVRDEGTTTHYAPIEIPALASYDFIANINLAAQKLELTNIIYTGMVHCKDSLYAREFGAGPLVSENTAYLHLLSENGVFASEMETSTLFIQTQIYNHQLRIQTQHPLNVTAGAILAIVSEPPHTFAHNAASDTAIAASIELAIETIKLMAIQAC
jgi:uridine phosphorylase